MSSITFAEKGIGTIDRNLNSPRTARQHPKIKELMQYKEDSRNSTKKDKIDFFRRMGLEFSKTSLTNDNNNNDFDILSTIQSRKSHCSMIDIYNEVERSEDSLYHDLKSKKRNIETSYSCDINNSVKNILHMRECSVTIIGEKCKICGKSFKCIKDVQIHVKKKHRSKKPRKNLIFKIGSEIISRVSIKTKHLKWNHTIDDCMIVDNEKTSLCDEEEVPFVDLDSDCDINDSRSIIPNKIVDKSREYREIDEDEEIQVLLRITRPRTSGLAMEINHETPNRAERELLITDAIREFVRMDDEPMNSNGSEKEFDNKISDDCSWMSDDTLPYSEIDHEEKNCTFHIENENDIEFITDTDYSTTNINNSYFEDEKKLHTKEFYDVNDDIVPKLIGNTIRFNDPVSYQSYNNNVYELHNSFYDSRINEWNHLNHISNSINRNEECIDTFVGSSVLIKEEIMLDDLS